MIAMKAADDNLARIRTGIDNRPDVQVVNDVFSFILGMSSNPGQDSPMLSIKAGSSSLQISAGAQEYVITGTDCGYDWLHHQSQSVSPGDTVTVDVGPSEDIVVMPSEMQGLLSHTQSTSYPYDLSVNGRDCHALLQDYIDNWITAHALVNDGPAVHPENGRPPLG